MIDGVRSIVVEYIKDNFHLNNEHEGISWYEKDDIVVEIRETSIAVWFDWKHNSGWGGSRFVFRRLDNWNTADYVTAYFTIKGLLNSNTEDLIRIGYKTFLLEWCELDDADLHLKNI